MRKVLLVVTSVLAALLIVLPIAAQEDTIADVVVAATQAEEPQFTTLLTAVQAADPAVLEALSNPEAELTVFAPTDAAFAAAAEALGEEAFNALLADTEALTGVLLFHVVEGTVMSEAVVATLEENDGAFSVPTLNGQYLDIATTEDGITVDGAPLNLEMVDIETANGVIHVIDAVMLPEARTIAEIVVASAEAEEPQFATLLAAVQAADPTVLELLSDPEAELTVFAPTDAAFAALAESFGDEEAFNSIILGNSMVVTTVLQLHVLEGVVYSGDVVMLLDENMMEPIEVQTLAGSMLTVASTEDGITLNGGATIVMTDIDAANGLIHVIDATIPDAPQ